MRILPITNSVNQSSKNFVLIKCNKHITKNPSFNGLHYPSGFYTDEEIADAYKYLSYSDSDWEDIAHYEMMSKQSFFKYVFWGGAEQIREHLKQVAKLRKDIQIQEQEMKKKMLKLQELNKINFAQVQLEKNYFKMIKLKQDDENTLIPNGIMVENNNNESFIKFLSWLQGQNYIISQKLNLNDIDENQFLKELKNQMNIAKEVYEYKNKYTLLYLQNFEKFATMSDDNKKHIAALKALMCSCADKYKCTLLVDLPQIHNVDPILLVDSRINLRLKI